MIDPAIERDRLARHICERVRVLMPRMRVDDYSEFRSRVQKTSLPVLREIVDCDAVGEVARAVLPQGLGAR